jgi:hypothetical protein
VKKIEKNKNLMNLAMKKIEISTIQKEALVLKIKTLTVVFMFLLQKRKIIKIRYIKWTISMNSRILLD